MADRIRTEEELTLAMPDLPDPAHTRMAATIRAVWEQDAVLREQNLEMNAELVRIRPVYDAAMQWGDIPGGVPRYIEKHNALCRLIAVMAAARKGEGDG